MPKKTDLNKQSQEDHNNDFNDDRHSDLNDDFNDDYTSWDAATLKAFLSGSDTKSANEMAMDLGWGLETSKGKTSLKETKTSHNIGLAGFNPLKNPDDSQYGKSQELKNRDKASRAGTAKIPAIKIIHETADWLVINKPPYIPSLPERGKYTAESVMEWAKKKWDDAILCHRLDRETSGCLIIAKTPEAYRHISIQFEKRQVRKLYHAIVDGKVNFQELWVDLPINTENVLKIRIDKQTGKSAQTLFNTIQNFNHFTLIECQPRTGRLHQIRVHLASQNAKIAGDLLYGSQIPKLSLIKRKLSGDDTVLISRFALHAREVEFQDLDGTPMSFQAEYPKDMEVFLKLLNKYDK
jgi:23S rRNA pseudouridine955/2504/2580 synthase